MLSELILSVNLRIESLDDNFRDFLFLLYWHGIPTVGKSFFGNNLYLHVTVILKETFCPFANKLFAFICQCVLSQDRCLSVGRAGTLSNNFSRPRILRNDCSQNEIVLLAFIAIVKELFNISI